MRKALASLLLILLGLASSLIAASYGWYELEMARAEKSFLAFDFDSTQKRLNGVQKYVNYGRKLPLLNSWLLGADSKKAEVDYWQKEYQSLTVENVGQESLEPIFDFIKANSLYRQIESEKNRTKVLEGLDAAIASYVQVINKDEQNLNAAFNYEYLLRIRNSVMNKKMQLPLKGSEKQPDSNERGIHGQEGQQAKGSSENKIKIHIPMGPDEIERNEGGNDAGKGEVKRKKG